MNNKLALYSIIVVCLVMLSVFSASAKADTLTFVGYDPVTFARNVSVNGSVATQIMVCLEETRVALPGETWNVSVQDWSTASTETKEQAYIFSQLGVNGVSYVDDQFAAWDITSPALAAGFLSPTAAALAAAAQVAVLTLPANFYDAYVVYVPLTDPVSQQGWSSGEIPQDFIGNSPVPEPSSLLLFGSGVVGLAGIARRKLARS